MRFVLFRDPFFRCLWLVFHFGTQWHSVTPGIGSSNSLHSSHEVCGAFSTSLAFNHCLIPERHGPNITNHHNIISDAIWITEKMGVSKNNGTPKSSILIGFSIIFTIHFGGKTPYFWKHPNLYAATKILYATHRTCTRHRKFIHDSEHHENEILGPKITTQESQTFGVGFL